MVFSNKYTNSNIGNQQQQIVSKRSVYNKIDDINVNFFNYNSYLGELLVWVKHFPCMDPNIRGCK